MSHYESHCGKKRRYASERDARMAASSQFRKKGRLLDVYLCRYGEDHWHTGGPSLKTPLDEFRGVGIRERRE